MSFSLRMFFRSEPYSFFVLQYHQKFLHLPFKRICKWEVVPACSVLSQMATCP